MIFTAPRGVLTSSKASATLEKSKAVHRQVICLVFIAVSVDAELITAMSLLKLKHLSGGLRRVEDFFISFNPLLGRECYAYRYLSVTAPSEALATRRAYLAKTPRVSFGAGGT